MARNFVDTPEASSNRSPIMEENDSLHRRNQILFGILVYTYVAIASAALGWGVASVIKTCI